jgi:hypothetical protein
MRGEINVLSSVTGAKNPITALNDLFSKIKLKNTYYSIYICQNQTYRNK